ncbi:hypothetical protein [uncultured Duncaniella sp.]|uniref:hypothetical protein n=1 Tax=uncultured Duncaniella sp. TaxID=2768039 RepID=UPI0025AA1B91|nr:hypothetical protein [uncultured Duncaniella sp.]
MGNQLLNIANTARQEVLDDNDNTRKLRKERRKKERAAAEHAYEVFHSTLSQLLGIKSYKIGPSSLISRTDCVIIEDTGGRKFEIHYKKVLTPDGKHFGCGDCDFHINTQWGTDTWYTFSVGMNIGTVAQQLGRWLAETQTANSLKCK